MWGFVGKKPFYVTSIFSLDLKQINMENMSQVSKMYKKEKKE